MFGPHADEATKSADLPKFPGLASKDQKISLIPIPSDLAWGKSANDLVNAVYNGHVLALIALDRASSHLAEQIAIKSFVPVIAISSDRALTSTNIPWIFRLPEGTPLTEAVECLSSAIAQAGPSRLGIRELLASGKALAGIRFESTGEMK